jgi:hypothetical protein
MSKFGNQYSLKEALSSMIGELHIEDKLHEVQIRDLWRELLGDAVASNTLKMSLNEGVLWVKVNSSALKQELNYTKLDLIQLINSKLGLSLLVDMIIY